MTDLCIELIDLLGQQLEGGNEACDRISTIAGMVSSSHVYRDPELTPQQVRGVEILLSEWSGMFSFQGGRMDGIAPIVRLLKSIKGRPKIEQVELYETKEWREIVGLRGPVETVLFYECSNCHTEYPRMGMSGFLDMHDLLCTSCGAVTFRPNTDPVSKTAVACRCGGVASIGCPSCGGLGGTPVREISPYQYFASHRYYRDEAR